MKAIKYIIGVFTLLLIFNSCDKKECNYVLLVDCPALELNYGDPCSVNDDGEMNGTVTEDCGCVPNVTTLSECPGFIQNGDFETVTGDPNAVTDNDIDLATGWKALWQGGASLADLFNDSTTSYGAGCFIGPTPTSGVFAGMWVENNINASASNSFREGFFNELNATINQNTGNYTLSFDYANMSANCFDSKDVKVGVYGVYHESSDLPSRPTNLGIPSNLDLFGAANTVFLGEIVITSSTTNTWQQASFTIDTSALTFPTNGINHIMITNSHLPFDAYGKMYAGFDNFCLIN